MTTQTVKIFSHNIPKAVKQMHDTTVIYHYGCADGLAGLWCFKDLIKQDPSNKHYDGKFSNTISIDEVKGRNLIFVDFTYRIEEMKQLLEHANHILVLDHHKTALDLLELMGHEKFSMILDMTRSGAQIAWNYTRATYTMYTNPDTTDNTDTNSDINTTENITITDHKGNTTTNNTNTDPTSEVKSYADQDSTIPAYPWFIDDIADRDLWKWQIPESKESTKAMNALQFYKDLESFDTLTVESREDFVKIGRILTKIDNMAIEQISSRAIKCYCTSPLDPTKTWTCMLLATSHNFASEIGMTLSEKYTDTDFAAMYRYDILSDEWWISLRAASKSNTDLTEVAKYFSKGGGHPKAAGITLLGNKGQTLRSIFTPIPKEEVHDLLQQPGTSMGEPSQM